jgi:hypothetical protein
MGSLLLALAVAMLVVALLAPAWRARAFDRRVASVVAAVEAVRTEAEAVLSASGRWPPSSVGGGWVSGAASPDSSVTLEWRRLSSAVVPIVPSAMDATAPGGDDAVAPEPPVIVPEYFERGAISVHSGNDALLARLLERYPRSLVHDTVWTLVFPRVPRGSAPPS